MPTKKKVFQEVHVFVECYRMSDEEVEDLKELLCVHDGIEDVGAVACRKASGAIELGNLFLVIVVPFLAQYAGTKVLDFVTDEVKGWFKRRRKKSGFITLELNGRRKKVGKGTPKRYRL